MSMRELTLKHLSRVDDGKIRAALDHHLAIVGNDCEDRPGSLKVRKVTLELFVTPAIDPDTGQCDDVNIEFEVGSKVPKHRSKPINCKIRKTPKGVVFLFNDMNEEDLKQRTLDEAVPSFTKKTVGTSAIATPEDDDEEDEDSELDEE